MGITVYVDGSGGSDSGFGFLLKKLEILFMKRKEESQIIKLNILP